MSLSSSIAALATRASTEIKAVRTALGTKVDRAAIAANAKTYGAVGNGTVDDTAALQALLNLAGELYIPAGTYRITVPLWIKPNTHLTMAPSCIIVNDTTVSTYPAFVNGQYGNATYATGYNGDSNIKVTGGIVDSQPKKTRGEQGQAFAFAHARNIVVEGVTCRNQLMSHFIEFNAVSNGTIRDCIFDNLDPSTGSSRECINIDGSYAGGFPHFGSYDGTVCEDILVENNRFSNGQVAVGSHATDLAVCAHRRVSILNNSVYNMSQWGFRARGWVAPQVRGNRLDLIGQNGVTLDNTVGAVVEGNIFTNTGVALDNTHAVVFGDTATNSALGPNSMSTTSANRYSYPYQLNAGCDGSQVATTGDMALGSAGIAVLNYTKSIRVDNTIWLYLADDTAGWVDMLRLGQVAQGLLTISSASAGTSSPRGLYWARCDSSPVLQGVAVIGAADVVLTTGVILTGTTGTDVKVTMSAHTNGRLYIENRGGSTRRFAVGALIN